MNSNESFDRLHVKFTLSALLVIGIILIVFESFFNIYIFNSSYKSGNAFVEFVVQNEGSLTEVKNSLQQEPPRAFHQDEDENAKNIYIDSQYVSAEKTKNFWNFCSVKIYDKEHFEVVSPFYYEINNATQEELVSLGISKFPNKKDIKYKEFSIFFRDKDNVTYMIILDRYDELIQHKNFMLISIAVFISTMFFAFIITWFVSILIIQPIYDSILKQKRFIADTSHELKTPIAVISANIDVLEQELPGNKWLEYIKTENQRMSGLVKDMLYLAKDDAGRLEFAHLPFDLAECVANAAAPFETVAFEQEKQFILDVPKDVIPVEGDESKIKQLAIILIDNALKNSDPGAVITVKAGYENNNPYISVHNTGHGISKEDLKKIFDRFYRADTSRARTTGGYGLGLSIASTIAKGHNGKLTVESEEGKWAKFTFTYPGTFKVKRH